MPITLNAATTNNSDWRANFIFTNDAGELIDFTGAAVSVEVWDSNDCKRLDASLGNGIELLPGGGFQLYFPESQVKTLCPGTYNIGGVFEVNGEINSLFTGSVAITRGYASV